METIKNLPVFHGSDARVFLMSDDARLKFKKELIDLIDYMVPFFRHYYKPYPAPGEPDKMEELRTILDDMEYNNLYNALNHDHARRSGLYSWQYQDDVLYFTQNYSSAISYAQRHCVCGEIGTIATDIYLALEKINFENWHPNDEQLKTIEKIKELYYGEHFPILFIFDDYDIDDIYTGKGERFDATMIEGAPIMIFKTESVPFHRGHIVHLRSGDNKDALKAAEQALVKIESSFGQ